MTLDGEFHSDPAISAEREVVASIVIDARPLSGPPCGYTIYLCSVVACLRSAGFQIRLVSNEPIRPIYDEVAGLEAHVFGGSRQLRWEQVDLPKWLRAETPDIYFTGANRGVPFRKARRTRYVLGLLDVIPYLFPRGYFLNRWRTLIRHPGRNAETLSQLISLARADAILTISTQSAKDIRRLFHRSDVTPILIRLKDVEVPREIDPAQGSSPYFSYLGGVDYRKQIGVLLEAFALFSRRHAEHRLVLIGSNYPNVEETIERLGLGERVEVTGYVDHDTKFQILRQSTAMVYPSLYEGYGMAIAEAFQAEVPVIAGRGGSQEEICGGAARHIDPRSPAEIVVAMEEMLDPAKRAEWIALGRAQLAVLTDKGIEAKVVRYFTEQGRIARAA